MHEILSVIVVIVGVSSLLSFGSGVHHFHNMGIPQDCRVWSTGCNICQKNENGIFVCDDKVCHKYEITKAKCLEYEK